ERHHLRRRRRPGLPADLPQQVRRTGAADDCGVLPARVRRGPSGGGDAGEGGVMIWSALVASLVVVGLQDASAERPARPTDKELLAAVQAEVAGARIVSSEFTDTPRGGGRVGCGLFEAQGAIEPFRVFTSWYDGQPERIPPAVLNFGGEQGSRTAIPSEPQPAEPAHWKIRITAPALVDAGAAGI